MLQMDYAMSKQHFFMRHFNFCNYTNAISVMLADTSVHIPIQFSQSLFFTTVLFIKSNIAEPVVGLRPGNFMQYRSSSLISSFPNARNKDEWRN